MTQVLQKVTVWLYTWTGGRKDMNDIILDSGPVAYCGLFCGACGSFKKGKCSGCRETTGAGWCRIRICCADNDYRTCADCAEYEDPMDCKKFNNVFSKVVSFFTRSDRGACIKRIKQIGVDGYIDEMSKLGQQSIKKG